MIKIWKEGKEGDCSAEIMYFVIEYGIVIMYVLNLNLMKNH